MMSKRYYSVLVLLLCVFLFHTAFAAKCVKPNGNGGCFDNIQDALDAVAPGGTVQIYPGIYYANSFMMEKSGITVMGMGNKRTDVRIDGLGSPNNLISAADVTVKNLTVQNGNDGLTIGNTGSNAKILNVNILDSTWRGITVLSSADGILIKNCKISSSGTYGVSTSFASDIRIIKTTISHCGEHGIYSGGDNLTVDGCTIKNSEQSLIRATGSDAMIQNNQLFQAGEYGIDATSNFARVTDNMVKGTGFCGIRVNGVAPFVKNNTVMHTQDEGFQISCGIGCENSKVVNNLANYNLRGGFEINVNSSGMLIRKNKAFNNGFTGFSIIGKYGKTLLENQAKFNGDAGFFVDGYGTLENNIASENETHGFFLWEHLTAVQNKALNNVSSGFLVSQDHTTLRNNRAIGNLTHGIRVTGDNNEIINNTMLDSLYDKCDENSPFTTNTWTNNTYDTECL